MAPIVNLSMWLYQRLLRLYPKRYRQEVGREQALVFRDQCRDGYRQHGNVGVAALWISVWLDLIPNVMKERVDVRRRRATTSDSLVDHLPARFFAIFVLQWPFGLLLLRLSEQSFLQEDPSNLFTGVLVLIAVGTADQLRMMLQTIKKIDESDAEH